MDQNIQQICNEMDKKAYEFTKFQRAYHTDKATDQDLMERTTQPFWQSMRLSKQRLDAKGISLDIEITNDSKSKTIKDERLQAHKEGHHLVGNKTLDVITKRIFYKDGKQISNIKNREICHLALLKTEVDGDLAACPNCGYVNTITSFVDGCDACDSKFTVQDFETKVSSFSLEENTSEKIKDTVINNSKFLGKLIGASIVLGIIVLILAALRLILGFTGVSIMNVLLGFYTSVIMIPVTIKSVIVLAIIYAAGASYLVFRYKKPILQEEVIKQTIPDFSASDFYQNLEYTLRNVHLTESVEDANVFARCALDDVVADYQNIIDCDMNRLKFINIQADLDGYRMNVETKLRLTECAKKRITTNYEKLNLTLFAKQEVVNKSVTTLRQYSCPGCGAGINILEGGKCHSCGSVFDYAKFGWVIENYESKRQPISLYQFIKYVMIGLFLLIFGGHMLFPTDFGKETIFDLFEAYSEQLETVDVLYSQLDMPDTLYDDVTLVSSTDVIIEHVSKYEADNAASVVEQYRSYLDSMGFQFYKNTDNGFVVYKPFNIYGKNNMLIPYNYRITVVYDGNIVKIEEEIVEDLEEVINFVFDFGVS